MRLYFVDDNGHVQTFENGESCFLGEDDTFRVENSLLTVIAWDGEVVGEYVLWSSLRELADVIEDRM